MRAGPDLDGGGSFRGDSRRERRALAVSHLGRSGFFLRRFPGLPAWANVCRAYGAGAAVSVRTRGRQSEKQIPHTHSRVRDDNLALLRKLPGGAFFFAELRESLALICQARQQRGGLPDFAVLAVEFGDARVNFFQADCIRIPHGAAAIGGEAVAVEINNVYVRSAQGESFFE